MSKLDANINFLIKDNGSDIIGMHLLKEWILPGLEVFYLAIPRKLLYKMFIRLCRNN